MRRLVLLPVLVVLLLAGCGGGGSEDYGFERGGGGEASVQVDVADEATVRPAVEYAVDRLDDEGGARGWYIAVECAEDGSRVGTARFAKGAEGAAETGVAEGEYEFEFARGADCG